MQNESAVAAAAMADAKREMQIYHAKGVNAEFITNSVCYILILFLHSTFCILHFFKKRGR